MKFQSVNLQRGQSMWGNLVMAAVVIFAAVTLMKLWDPYYDDFAVAKAMENMENEIATRSMTPEEMFNSLNKRLEINDVVLGKNDVKVSKSEKGTVMDVAYEVRLPMYGNVDAVVKFKHSMSLPAE